MAGELAMPDPTSADPQEPHYTATIRTTFGGAGADVHVQCRAELDALREELADVREQLGLADADVETAMGMNVSLRARLKQAEAVVEAASAMLGVRGMEPHTLRPSVNRLRAALRAIPEAPPAKDHVNACPCWLCRPLHKPLPEAPPVAAGSGE